MNPNDGRQKSHLRHPLGGRGARGTDPGLRESRTLRLHDVYRHRADATTLARVSSQDEVGLARFYRAVSIGGNDPSLPEAVSLPEPGSKPQPCAPVPIRGIRNGAGDLTVTWIRWTRVSGEGRDLVDVPLNEARRTNSMCWTGPGGWSARSHRGNISRLFGHRSDHRLRRAQSPIELAVREGRTAELVDTPAQCLRLLKANSAKAECVAWARLGKLPEHCRGDSVGIDETARARTVDHQDNWSLAA
jgi:hypothetical protein